MPESDEEFRELCGDLMELAITTGMVDSVSERWPDDVQESWVERIQEVRGRIRKEIEEIHQFASSYDH